MKLSDQQADHLANRILLRKYHLARNQASFRGQEWSITKQEFFDLWREKDLWLDHGQAGDGYVMSRINQNSGWSADNVHIITREQMLKTKKTKRKANQ